MTVDELIEKLRAYPGDARVVVPGYETGVDDIDEPKLVSLYLDAWEENWNGPHMLAYEGRPGVPAVLIVDKRNGNRVKV